MASRPLIMVAVVLICLTAPSLSQTSYTGPCPTQCTVCNGYNMCMACQQNYYLTNSMCYANNSNIVNTGNTMSAWLFVPILLTVFAGSFCLIRMCHHAGASTRTINDCCFLMCCCCQSLVMCLDCLSR